MRQSDEQCLIVLARSSVEFMILLLGISLNSRNLQSSILLTEKCLSLQAPRLNERLAQEGAAFAALLEGPMIRVTADRKVLPRFGNASRDFLSRARHYVRVLSVVKKENPRLGLNSEAILILSGIFAKSIPRTEKS